MIVELWEEIFVILLNKGSFSILSLNDKDKESRKKWLSQRANIDLFMMFVISEVELIRGYGFDDETLKLFHLLTEKNQDLKALEGKRIYSKLEDTDRVFKWNELFISPYTLYIKE